MNAPRDRVVAAARAWIGTPYCHQASMRGAGADCLGLVLGVWREMGGTAPDTIPRYTPGWEEPDRNEVLLEAAERYLRRSAGVVERGRIVLFRLRAAAPAKHLGIVAETGDAPSFIHAYSGHGVVESPLSAPWRRRIVAGFEFPQGE